ncbi:MAG: hypothetical protein Q9165_008879 [Trypethelium subeluteriae]
MNPLWTSCNWAWEGLYDPPYALTQQAGPAAAPTANPNWIPTAISEIVPAPTPGSNVVGNPGPTATQHHDSSIVPSLGSKLADPGQRPSARPDQDSHSSTQVSNNRASGAQADPTGQTDDDPKLPNGVGAAIMSMIGGSYPNDPSIDATAIPGVGMPDPNNVAGSQFSSAQRGEGQGGDPNNGDSVGGEREMDPPSRIVIGGVALSKGEAITLGGVRYSLGPAGLAAGDMTTYAIPASFSDPTGGQSHDGSTSDGGNPDDDPMGHNRVDPGSGFAGQGDGDPSKAFDSSALSGISSDFSPSNPRAVITIGGQSYTATPGKPLFIGPTVILPDGPAATISGSTISLSTASVVVNGKMIPFTGSRGSIDPSDDVEEAAVTLSDGQVITAVEEPSSMNTAVLFGADGSPTTISVGGPAVSIGGHKFSLAASGLFVDSTYSVAFHSTNIGRTDLQGLPGKVVSMLGAFGGVPAGTAGSKEEVVFTADGQTFTAIEDPGRSREAVIGGSITLSVGSRGTIIDGESVSLAPEGLVLDGTTTGVFSVAGATEVSAGEPSAIESDGASSVQRTADNAEQTASVLSGASVFPAVVMTQGIAFCAAIWVLVLL